MSITSILKPFFEALQQGAWILTPHQHLSHRIEHAYAQYQPDTMSAKSYSLTIQTFINLCYDLLLQQYPHHTHPILLNHVQAETLWEISLKQAALHTMPIPFHIYEQCQEVGIPLSHTDFSKTELSQHFVNVAHHFETLLQQHHAITTSHILQTLAPFTLSFPTTHIIFACFDTLNLQHQQLQTYLQHHHVTVHHIDLSPRSTPTFLFTAKDETEEQITMFNWALHQSSYPIGLVVPHLYHTPTSFQYLLTTTVGKENLYMSRGEPLSQYPLVNHALCALALLEHEFDTQQALILLKSPFFKEAKIEQQERYLFSQHCISPSPYTLETWITMIQPHCPRLAACLVHITPYPLQASPKTWVIQWTKRLIELGFPDAPLYSQTYQCYQRFLELLTLFQTTTFLQPRLSFQVAFTQFKSLCQQTLFQIKQNFHAKIHVMDIFEASGCPFEHIWFMQAHDHSCPPPLSPTPFVPLSLQGLYSFPKSDAQKESQSMIKRINRIQSSTNCIIFSYAAIQDHEKRNVSSLIPDLQPFIPNALNSKTLVFEKIEEPKNIPLLPHETFSHSTYLLAEQAKCPFRAFASQRLKARKVSTHNHDALLKKRGIVLHQALEYFWKKVKTQAALQQLSKETLTHMIKNAVQKALGLNQTIEQQRLTQLIMRMMTWEKTRSPFHIEALEVTTTYQLGPLTFQLRIDRIDKVGEVLWVIDYKTTIPSPLPWRATAPLEPQLLLYALTSPLIQAIVFYGLDKGKIEIKGIEAASHHTHLQCPSPDQTWDQLKTTWQTYLTQLAYDFYHGYCVAQPTHSTLCETCTYSGLCRVALIGYNQ